MELSGHSPCLGKWESYLITVPKLQDIGNKWRQVIAQCCEKKEECIIHDEKDRPVAVVLSLEDFQAYQQAQDAAILNVVEDGVTDDEPDAIEGLIAETEDEVEPPSTSSDETPAALFGLQWRQGDRIEVFCRVELQVPGTDHPLEFCTCDLGVFGICLHGSAPDIFHQDTMQNPRAPMRIYMPEPYGVIEIEAELKWEREEDGQVLTGWEFARISRKARKMIHDYIESHPEDVLKEPSDEG
jgi:hypothetical protein